MEHLKFEHHEHDPDHEAQIEIKACGKFASVEDLEDWVLTKLLEIHLVIEIGDTVDPEDWKALYVTPYTPSGTKNNDPTY